MKKNKWGELSHGEKRHGEKCLMGRNVIWGEMLRGEMSWGEMLRGELSFGVKCYRAILKIARSSHTPQTHFTKTIDISPTLKAKLFSSQGSAVMLKRQT